jgi:hypothetical protein
MPPRFFCFCFWLFPLELLPLELLPRSLDARRKTSFRAMPGLLLRTSFTNSIHVLGVASALTIFYTFVYIVYV